MKEGPWQNGEGCAGGSSFPGFTLECAEKGTAPPVPRSSGGLTRAWKIGRAWRGTWQPDVSGVVRFIS